ncbi:MAG TPA: hypothetical protein PKN54_03120 [Candidatus Cloacimonas acidaminovorans]|nr:hypothetical protein [Candidatus Cloacimonas acidaminovorans]
MPRIYSDNEKHENLWCGGVNFEKGVGIATADADTSYFVTDYVVDTSKSQRTVFDDMTGAQLRQIASILQLTIDQGTTPDTKQTLVRAIETELSSKYRAAVTVSSAAGTDKGNTKISITGAGTYKYKTSATTAVNALYLDDVSDWNDIATGNEITPDATHDKIAVCSVDANGLVLGYGSADIIKKT